MSNGRDGADEVHTGALEISVEDKKDIPVLLSEDMLGVLIKNLELGLGLELQNDEEGSDEDDIGKVLDTDEESVERTLKFKKDGEEQKQWHKKMVLEEDDVGSSTDSEIPVDLDHVADCRSILEYWNTNLEANKPLATEFEEDENVDNELPTIMEDYDTQSNQDYDYPKDRHQEETFDQALPTESLQDEQILPDPETDQSKTDEVLSEEKERKKDTNESVGHPKGNCKKCKRLREPQHDQGLSTGVISEHSENQELEKEPETTLNLAQRKRGNLVRWIFIRHLKVKKTKYI